MKSVLIVRNNVINVGKLGPFRIQVGDNLTLDDEVADYIVSNHDGTYVGAVPLAAPAPLPVPVKESSSPRRPRTPKEG